MELKRDRESELDYWREVVQNTCTSTDDLVASAWADTLARYQIPRHYALQLIDGVARDLILSRYPTFDDLAAYCYSVASTVGLMSGYIVGFSNHDAIPYAIRLGIALQMTNILRDVGRITKMGGCTCRGKNWPAAASKRNLLLKAGSPITERQFMKFQVERTRRMYKATWFGMEMLDREGRLAIGAASEFCCGILDDIEKRDYDVFTRRAAPGAWGKISRIPGLWLKVKTQ